MAPARDARSAFTLVEMSFVLIIVGIVILMVFPAMKAMREGTQRSATINNLYTLMRASAAFTQAHGCLPCPTPAGTYGAGFGRVRGVANAAPCGTCNMPEGLPPFADLGLPASTAKDGWGRWITMRVDAALTINFGIVPPTALCLTSDPQPCSLGSSQKGLCRAGLPTANRISVSTPSGAAQQAAILFLSHGPNGFGAFTADPMAGAGSNQHPSYGGPASTCTATTGFELCNANGDASFVDAPTALSASQPFDDALVYLDRNALVSYLGQGACQTSW